MAEGTDLTPSSQNQIINLNTGDIESLQVLKLSTAPGVSMPKGMATETENKSRHGILVFKMIAIQSNIMSLFHQTTTTSFSRMKNRQ